jgi:hypothetical protein
VKKFGGGLNIMVWGIISSNGPEYLIWINRNKEKFNAE